MLFLAIFVLLRMKYILISKESIMRFLWLIGFMVLFFACRNNKEDKQTDASSTRLITNLDNVRLRDAPGESATVILSLPKGAVLYDLGEVSDFTTKIKLRGIEFDEPWLKVRTEDGTTGWVYGGALNFTMDDASQLATLLLDKRVVSLFGRALADSLALYRQHFHSIQSSSDLAQVYREGTALRDAAVRAMDGKIVVSDPNELPDLFWLEQAMPGFISQLVAEGTAYYLFWDYEILLQKAKQTADAPDDDFAHLAIAIFPEDSIEYFYPSWFIQTWDYGGNSLLGRGTHNKVLKIMDETLQKSDLFTPEIRQWKTLLFNDITQPDVSYWETQDKIIAELDTIITRNYSILTDADKVALQTRRQQFEDPATNSISVNQQSGN